MQDFLPLLGPAYEGALDGPGQLDGSATFDQYLFGPSSIYREALGQGSEQGHGLLQSASALPTIEEAQMSVADFTKATALYTGPEDARKEKGQQPNNSNLQAQHLARPASFSGSLSAGNSADLSIDRSELSSRESSGDLSHGNGSFQSDMDEGMMQHLGHKSSLPPTFHGATSGGPNIPRAISMPTLRGIVGASPQGSPRVTRNSAKLQADPQPHAAREAGKAEAAHVEQRVAQLERQLQQQFNSGLLRSISSDNLPYMAKLKGLSEDGISALHHALLTPAHKRKGKGGRQPAADPRLDPSIDRKRAKRILANRLSAARSKLKQKSHLDACPLPGRPCPAEQVTQKVDLLVCHQGSLVDEVEELRAACQARDAENAQLLQQLEVLKEHSYHQAVLNNHLMEERNRLFAASSQAPMMMLPPLDFSPLELSPGQAGDPDSADPPSPSPFDRPCSPPDAGGTSRRREQRRRRRSNPFSRDKPVGPASPCAAAGVLQIPLLEGSPLHLLDFPSPKCGAGSLEEAAYRMIPIR